MAGFSAQPDEGYSEDPLNALSAASFPSKHREDAVSALVSVRPDGDFPALLAQYISSLSMSRKTGMSLESLIALCNHTRVRPYRRYLGGLPGPAMSNLRTLFALFLNFTCLVTHRSNFG